MYPLGHLAAGYVAYSLVTKFTTRRSPGEGEVLAVLFGTQFPDLVDKPLAWWFHLLPSGRTLAHSVYVTAAVLIVVGYVAIRLDREPLAQAFGFGYVSHLVGDSVYALDALDTLNTDAISFLAWPLTNPIVYVVDWHAGPYLQATALTPTFGWELVFGTVVCALWLIDGRPGLAPVRKFVGKR